MSAERVRGTLPAAAVGLVVGAIVTLIATRAHATLLYTDAQSHLTIARRITDNRSPGLAQIGTVWLPVYHLLLLPFVQNYWLWRTGLAAGIVGGLCTAVSSGALWRIARRLRLPPTSAAAAVAVLLTNPSLLYLQTTGLDEPTLLAFTLLMGAGLIGWATAAKQYSGGELVVFAGLPAAAGVLTRYDGWATALAGALFVVITSWRRYGRWRYSAKLAALFLTVPGVAMTWWLTFNAVRFGDPLSFERGPFSARAQQSQLDQLGLLLTRHCLPRSISTYTWTLADMFGAAVLAVAFAGLLALLWRRGLSTSAVFVYMLFTPIVFFIVTLWLGQTAIRSAHTLPAGLFNLRFASPVLPLVALLVAFAHDAVRTWLPARIPAVRVGAWVSAAAAPLVVAALSVTVLPALHAPRDVPVIAEGYLNVNGQRDADAAAAWVAQHYRGGGILIDEGANPVLMKLGVPLRETIPSFTGGLFQAALHDPQQHAALLFAHDGPDDRVWAMIRSRPAVDVQYAVVFRAGAYVVYRRVDAELPR